ncbi:hypothetical protein [Actinoplanes xinjiangensis]|uniref:Uncharacterized protein n=1 Tax=Actinoplanes xinjiangensis TaxID=512350 RepID=A0A316ECZ3_9ACTN|nr:hypothetical protein [Actinoplanes xinjiangensis]PWK28043.1 hypothetical protein BC793_15117 [Actinoplanes xinjiangensis]GIF45216.1 hypothetical protein Axi01nite_95270 [Actinoplanes xinjiangensis]
MEALTAWLELAEARIQLMGDAVGFVTDRSAGSLVALQRALPSLDHEMLLGAAAYLGESLLEVAGGEWRWDERAGGPLVVAGPELGLAPVAPLEEIDAAAGGPAGSLASLHHIWSAAAGPTVPEPVEWAAWQQEAFPAWAATYGPDVTWDFSVSSLDRLEQALRRSGVPAAALTDGSRADFSGGASWYLGEVLRRGLGGVWEDDFEYASLRHVGPGHSRIWPVLALASAVDEPGALRAFYATYSGDPLH